MVNYNIPWSIPSQIKWHSYAPEYLYIMLYSNTLCVIENENNFKEFEVDSIKDSKWK